MDSIYSDIDINLYRQTDGDITIDRDVQAIYNSLENIVKTIQGQRRMRPDFAYGPYYYLFEAITAENAQALGELLMDVIEQYENRIHVTNIHVEYDGPGNQYTVTISFTLLGRTIEVVPISFVLKRL